MKSLTAYYFFLLYATVALKPVKPLLGGAFSHAFAEAKHLSTVHAHHGHHQLDHELAEEGEDHDHERNHTLPKGEELLQIHLSIQHNLVDLKPVDFNQDYPSLRPEKLLLTFLAKQIPPPKIFLS